VVTWQTGFWDQYVTLVRRNLLSDRDRYLSKLHFSQLLFVAVFAGLVWFRTDRTERTAEDRIGIVRPHRHTHTHTHTILYHHLTIIIDKAALCIGLEHRYAIGLHDYHKD